MSPEAFLNSPTFSNVPRPAMLVSGSVTFHDRSRASELRMPELCLENNVVDDFRLTALAQEVRPSRLMHFARKRCFKRGRHVFVRHADSAPCDFQSHNRIDANQA